MKPFSQYLKVTSSLTLGWLATSISVRAQIVRDTTLPNNSVVNVQGELNTITGGTQAGGNLFHSFRQFSLQTGGIARFNNALDIQNIISRVTGRTISNIDGLIAANGTANLFFINPNGIIFGPNAKLDIGGSFVGTTANSLIFSDGTHFSATNPRTQPLLTVSVPLGLQLGPTPGRIVVQGQGQNFGRFGRSRIFDDSFNPFQVQPGRTLALVGGEIQVDGGILQAPGGRVELGGLAGVGMVGLNADGSLTFPDGVARADVLLTNKAAINVLNVFSDDRGGSIGITGRYILLSGRSLLSTGIARGLGDTDARAGNITLNAAGVAIQASRIENNVNPGADGNSGDISINAGSFLLTDGAELNTTTLGVGNGGTIFIEAGSLSLTDNASIDAGVFGQGNAGDIEVRVNGAVSLENSRIFSDVLEKGQGDGGNINIQAGALFLTNAQLFADNASSGLAGNVYIDASDGVSLVGSSITSESNNDDTEGFGGITILAPQGSVYLNQARLSTSNTGSEFAGDIVINARDQVAIVNQSTISSNGRFGRILIGKSEASSQTSSPRSIIIDGASTLTTNNSASRADEQTSINAGDVSLAATDSIFITNESSLEAVTSRTGDAGSISLWTENGEVSLQNSRIFSDVLEQAQGDGGNIDIQARALFLTNARLFADNASSGLAGNVYIDARDEVSLVNSSITSTSASNRIGSQDFNVIRILAPQGSVYLNQARLSTTNTGSGFAGDIVINARDQVSIVNQSTISSNGQLGRILIGKSEASGEISSPRSIILDGASTLTTNNSASRADEQTSIDAGDVSLAATDSIFITNGSSLQASTSRTGDAGSISLQTENGEVSLSNSRVLSNSEQASGDAGDIEISTGSLKLDNRSQITAETASGNGGNIRLQTQDLLVLRHNSLISTTAGTAQAGGDGGNLNINSQFIVAVPSENSDIRANAFTGKGGEIQIGTQGIFGTQFRPKDTPLSDITASSDFGVSGVVQITTPRVDPSQGLVELPANVVDAEGLIAQDLCRTRGEESAFLVTGRGGLPTNPNEVIAPDAVVVEWANQNPGSSGASSSREKLPTASVPQQNNSSGVINARSKKVELREAQGWAIAPDGKVILTAEAPKLTPHSPGLTSPGCQSNKD